MEQLGTELSWTEDSESIARFTLCFEWKRMLTKHVCMLWVVWGFWVFICLSMMMASNVLEGIQKLELLTDLREALWTKNEIVLDWFDHVVGHVWTVVFMVFLGCCKCGHEHIVQSSYHGRWWKSGRDSDGIWGKNENFQEIWCHEYRNVVLSCHDMRLEQEVSHFRGH